MYLLQLSVLVQHCDGRSEDRSVVSQGRHLVRPGQSVPSQHQGEVQDAAPHDLQGTHRRLHQTQLQHRFHASHVPLQRHLVSALIMSSC